MAARLVIATLIVVGSLTLSAQTKTPIFVFTATDPSGFVDSETAARLKVVDDTRKALASSKRLAVVDTADTAAILVEIKGTSTSEETDASAALANSMDRLSGGLKAAGANRDETKKVKHQHATLKVGAYSTELDVVALGWKSTANAIEDWAKRNQAQLQIR